MNRTLRVIAIGVLSAGAAILVACERSATTVDKDDAERAALTERVEKIREELAKPDADAAAVRPEFDRLAADVKTYNARTGDDDIRVDSSEKEIARDNDGDGGEGCDDCDGYLLEVDRICFLESQECPETDPTEDINLGTICVYSCISIAATADAE